MLTPRWCVSIIPAFGQFWPYFDLLLSVNALRTHPHSKYYQLIPASDNSVCYKLWMKETVLSVQLLQSPKSKTLCLIHSDYVFLHNSYGNIPNYVLTSIFWILQRWVVARCIVLVLLWQKKLPFHSRKSSLLCCLALILSLLHQTLMTSRAQQECEEIASRGMRLQTH